MLKPKKDIRILTTDDYIQLFGKPRDEFNDDDREVLNRWIIQAENQFDALVSPSNNSGYLFKWWESLKNNDEDNNKGYQLQYAIGSWVETMVLSGKYWVDNVPTLSSNIQYNINSSSKDSNIEAKRKDIIQTLNSIGLTITTNFGGVNNNREDVANDIGDLVVLTKDYLSNNYLGLDSDGLHQKMKSGIDMSECPIKNSGDIWNTNPNKREINNFRLKNCSLTFEDNNKVEVQKAIECDKILEPNSGLYKFINQFDVKYFGGLTEQQINNRIRIGGSVWSPTIEYAKGFIVLFIKRVNVKRRALQSESIYGFAMSKIDNNIGNDPNTSPDAWEILTADPVEINAVIQQIKKYVDENIVPKLENTTIPNEIKNQLDTLPTLQIAIFNKGEIRNFKTLSLFNEIKTKYNLQESVDYRVIESGRYLVSGENGNVGGSDKLSIRLGQDNLPHIEWSWFAQANYNNVNNQAVMSTIGKQNCINVNKQGSNLHTTGNWNSPPPGCGTWYTIKLNDNQVNYVLDNKPKYQETYIVEFLRTIYVRGVVETGAIYQGGKDITINGTTINFSGKSLDNLVNGNNIVLTNQGDSEVFINTTPNLNVNSLSSESGVITINSETHFDDIPHIKSGIIIENSDLSISSEIDMLDNDLKVINNSGDILLITKDNNVSVDNIKTNLDKISQLESKDTLLQQEINDISINHNLTIDNNESAKWELGLVFSELDPSDISKGTAKLVPSTLKEYQLKHNLLQLENRIKSLETTIKSFGQNGTQVIHYQTFSGVESKGNENNIGESFYGYNPKEWPNKIPLPIQVGVATFGNIFGVDYQEWDGVEINGNLVAWGTSAKIGNITIDLTDNKFQCNVKLPTITLYKKVKGGK